MITIEEVITRKQKKQFRNLTDTLYDQFPNYVSPIKLDLKGWMNNKKHPFFEHGSAQFFIAYKDSIPTGRICAYKNNKHNDYHKDAVGFFGSFECINDQAVAKALLDTAQQWLQSQGLNEMRGPVDYYSNEPQGLLIEGFDSYPPAPLAYHPPYYSTLLETYGFRKQADLYAYGIKEFNSLPFHRGKKFVERLTKRNNIHFRPLDMKNLQSEIKTIVELFNIFEAVNGQNFIPITEKEVAYFIKAIKPILDPNLIYYAEHENRVIGFVATIPDVNELLIEIKHGRLFPTGIFKLLTLKKKRFKRLRVLLLGLRDEYKKIGLGPALTYKALLQARQHGFQSLDMSMIHEDNQLMLNTCKRLGGEIYKTYRVYKMGITK